MAAKTIDIKIKLIAFAAAGVSSFFGLYAADILPWPGYRSAQAQERVEDRVTSLEHQVIREQIKDCHELIMQMEILAIDKGYTLEDAPPVTRSLYLEKKRELEELKIKAQNYGRAG